MINIYTIDILKAAIHHFERKERSTEKHIYS